jgi:hypothetical protein
MDGEALDDRDHRRQRRAAGADRIGDRGRLPLPSADAPLVLLRHAAEKRGDQSRDATGRGERHRAAARIALVRHGRGSTAGLRRLRDLELHQQRDVARDLGERPGIDAARRDERCEAFAMAVPRCAGVRQPQVAREILADAHAVRAERRQRPRRAAELHDARVVERRRHRGETARRRREPSRGLQPERRRRRRLQQRPRQHHGVAVLLGQAPQRRDETLVIRRQHASRALQAQGERRVGKVLARRAPVDERRRGRCRCLHARDQRLDERRGDGPRSCALRASVQPRRTPRAAPPRSRRQPKTA